MADKKELAKVIDLKLSRAQPQGCNKRANELVNRIIAREAAARPFNENFIPKFAQQDAHDVAGYLAMAVTSLKHALEKKEAITVPFQRRIAKLKTGLESVHSQILKALKLWQ